jgi:hypothetical protein
MSELSISEEHTQEIVAFGRDDSITLRTENRKTLLAIYCELRNSKFYGIIYLEGLIKMPISTKLLSE